MKKIYNQFIVLFLLLGLNKVYSQKALSFDGINDVVDMGFVPLFNITDTLTLELKVKQSSTQNYPTFAGNFQDSSGYWKGYWMGGDNTGKATWYLGVITSTNNGYYLNSTTTIADGNWHHLSGVVFGDSAKLYIDGVLETSTVAVNSFLYSTEKFTLGNDALNDIFNGTIDDVRLWKTARTSAQILQYKDSCLKGNEAGLVALYHMEKGLGGSTLYDLTANNNNGTLTNMDTNTVWVTGVNCTACQVYPTSFSVSQVSLTLSSNQNGATYTWLDCGNSYSVIAGATMQSYTVSTNGSYAVSVKNNNCIDTSACINVFNVGISENSFHKGLNYYPNPSNGKFNIELGEAQSLVQVNIFDYTGKLISTENYYNTNIIRSELIGLSGLYIVEIISADQRAVIKIAKY